MLFHSLEFLLGFLPVVLLGFFLLGRSAATRPLAPLWLAAASLFFYAWWNPPFVLLLLASIAGNYVIGQRLLQQPSRTLLAVGIAADLALIGYFKYVNFFLGTLDALTGLDLFVAGVFLPLGISFFTFQQIAYLVDAYRGEVRSRGIVDYALFVSFFPQLIAGPIVHHAEMMPQFQRADTYRPRADSFALGLSVFTFGLVKKVVIADGMALYATPVFDAALAGRDPTFFEAWGGALAYTFQLYFDFSGYSDMAIGLARMFNISLPFNFDSPYQARNIIEFWRRWHMTLSRFLRDYLYIPLGGGRRGQLLRWRNLVVTMLLGGLWHGAAWTFVAWGALHGLYLAANHGWRHLMRRIGRDPDRPTLPGALAARALTFLAVVVGWVLFRAGSFDAAARVLAGMAGLNGVVVPEKYFVLLGPLGPVLASLGVEFRYDPTSLFFGAEQVAWTALAAAIAFLLPNTQQWFRLEGARPLPPLWERFAPRPVRAFSACVPQAAALGLTAAGVLLALLSDTPREFLYFQF